MRTKYDLFIDGRFTEPRTKSYLPDISPWNGKTIAEVAAASREDIDDAVLSAVKAQETWSLVFPAGRERVLLKAAELMEENAEDYASFIAEESGGTLMKGRNEVQGAAGSFITAAGECRRIYGNVIPSGWNSHLSVAVRVPRGVVAAIGPYNFPLGLLAGKAAYAVAAGNGAVLKSSSATPVAAYIIAEVLFKAGVPAGLVNAVSGPGDTIGDALVGHPLVDMVSFTGSTEAGRRINMRASQTFKKVCLEMGGKSPMLVLRDADVDDAVQKAAAGIFMHQGQVFMANSRIIVEAPVFGRFVEKLKDAAERLKLGSESDRDADIGPIISQKQLAKIEEHVLDALNKGATLVTGGRSRGQFYLPTVLTDVGRGMKIYNEETFGPVVSVYKVDSLDEGIDLANDTCYGLSGAVMTNDLGQAMKAARGIRTGMLHVNDSAVYGDPYAPFGGVKESGNAREGGMYSLEEYTQWKWITVCANKSPM